MNRKIYAFTLIELLIVVAIIAILAAIAVPNFLEAQTRSKVSRVKSDMRTITTALESYDAVNNDYPPNDGIFFVTPTYLTTPISFITSRPIDPFTIGIEDPIRRGIPYRSDEGQHFTYWRIVTIQAYSAVRDTVVQVDFDAGGNRGALKKYGKWYQNSIGPDGYLYDLNAGEGGSGVLPAPGFLPWGYSFDVPYDATNGTQSFGNIIRTQLTTEGTMPYSP